MSGQQSNRSGFLKTFSGAFSVLKILTGAGGILLLFGTQESSLIQWEPILASALESYEYILNKILSPVETLIIWLYQLAGRDFELGSLFKPMFVVYLTIIASMLRAGVIWRLSFNSVLFPFIAIYILFGIVEIGPYSAANGAATSPIFFVLGLLGLAAVSMTTETSTGQRFGLSIFAILAAAIAFVILNAGIQYTAP